MAYGCMYALLYSKARPAMSSVAAAATSTREGQRYPERKKCDHSFAAGAFAGKLTRGGG
jgi:hypothetical protein